MYDWVTLLYRNNWHNIINQLYFNKKKFLIISNNLNSKSSGVVHLQSKIPVQEYLKMGINNIFKLLLIHVLKSS